MDCEMTHDRYFEMPHLTGWVIYPAVIDNRGVDSLDRGRAERPATTKTPTDGCQFLLTISFDFNHRNHF
jgi:hypothetical protein